MYKNIFLKKYFKFFLVVCFFNISFLNFKQLVFADMASDLIAKNCQNTGYASPQNTNVERWICPSFTGNGTTEDYYVDKKTGQAVDQNLAEAQGLTGKDLSCSIWRSGISELFVCVIDFIAGKILSGINWFLSYIVSFSSLVFDFTVYTTIVKFKQNFVDLKLNVSGDTISYTNVGVGLLGTQGASLIDYVWGIIRDTLNIFIFILVIYSAVRSMFEGFENTRKKFVWLLVFSIVVNFSLLFVKLAIDVSNIIALEAYTLAVKPAGTTDFIQFRTAAANQDSKSYGEYIMNSIDLNKILNKQTGIDINKSEQIQGIQSTFMFQLGRFIVYVGIIYILLFMSGVLIARAVNFLLAMVLAPLIAAEIFFSTVGKNAGSQTQELVKKIQGITRKTKNDFGEALVKGPLLIFVVFLIGVFADSIVGSGIANEITRSASSLGDVQNLGSVFSKSLSVFFKFAIFFALCQVLFSKLNDIASSFGGSGMLSSWGSKFANATLGRSLAGLGVIGRNTLGRVASNPNGRIGGFLANANNRFTEMKSSENFLVRNIGKVGQKTTSSIRTGSYDGRSGLTKLGQNILKASGAKDAANAFNLGKSTEVGYEKLLGKRVEKAVDNIKGDIDAVKKGMVVTGKHIESAKKEISIDGTSLKVSKFEGLMGDKNFMQQLKTNPESIDLIKTELTKKDLEFLAGAAKGDSEILSKIDAARDKVGKKAEEYKNKDAKKIQDKIKEQVKRTVQPDANFIERNLARSGSNYGQLLGDSVTGNRSSVREGVAQKFRESEVKGAKEDSKNKKKIVDFITNKFNGSVGDAMKDLKTVASKQIDAVKRSSKTKEEKDAEINKINEVQKEFEKELRVFVSSLPQFYTTKEDSLKRSLETFDKETYKKVMEEQKKIHEHIIEKVSELSKDPNADVTQMIRNIGKRTATLSSMDELYKKAKPEEHSSQDGDKIKADKPAEKTGGTEAATH